MPYKCSSCSSYITNCATCFSNSSGVFCTSCDASLNLGLNSNLKSCDSCGSNYYVDTSTKSCTLCSNIFSNCETCFLGGTACTSCTIQS